ncbi:outer membrane-stress sensor serine endopeptidase DegS [Leminorella grimontii]|uniref:Serine endoprotease DegS n=1 Tax=Leminorella grimontii TaxID=82981 RepID=A0AAV5N669_9GAMM|nr:outer membrane-stress sensor serine endopeptidase DegS [Leminorella grimontii]KFC94716.1 outer membrane stress sensor protease [Leminorella grimontii ATCC 33999 = DSM 5078]GKX56459.1 outer membrane-stress sensor serine endopeptidase DegS [Leminorella grimontii]GKX59940.1 outer membrane-stress sensor serine endopeptidase DegS [Leminorella grimontii]VFS61345.1 Serine endoprotease DegS precursor [Leminorella grimontii]
MFAKLLRSILIGLIIAATLLTIFPSLRDTSGLLDNSLSLSLGEAPASYNSAVKRAAPAVVNIYNRNIHSQNGPGINTLGSGVIMNKKGYILTNRHVIVNADQIIVALQNGQIDEALVVGSDTLTDLAVLKIQEGNLPVIPINTKRTSHVGDVVLAIGNPYNLGQTVTQGIISATGRIGLSPYGRQNLLQTDASINHGNSGGALVNSLGELVGINTLSLDKRTDGDTPEGISFAIPIELATKIMDKLIRDGRVIRGYIGIGGGDLGQVQAQSGPFDRLQGILVRSVTPGGPADRAGIQAGDILLSVNGKAAGSVLEVMDQIAEIRPGTSIPVEVLRRGQKTTVTVTIAEYPAT